MLMGLTMRSVRRSVTLTGLTFFLAATTGIASISNSNRAEVVFFIMLIELWLWEGKD